MEILQTRQTLCDSTINADSSSVGFVLFSVQMRYRTVNSMYSLLSLPKPAPHHRRKRRHVYTGYQYKSVSRNAFSLMKSKMNWK